VTDLPSRNGRPPHSPATRDLAVRSLLAGTPLRELSRQTGIGRNTLKRWRAQARVDLAEPADPHIEPQDLGPPLMDLIREQIAAMRSVCRLLRDPRWLRRQPAGQLALLYDRVGDRLYRLLAALETGDRDADNRRAITLTRDE
jgi:transposase-like protein